MEEKKKVLTAHGIDVDGNRIKFDNSNGILSCPNRKLISITIPEGTIEVWCYENQLTELIIPMGVKYVNCWDNKITHLILPKSVTHLSADKEVIGLDRYMSNVDIDLS